MNEMAKQVGVMSWRGRLVFDAYLRLPDGMGTHRNAVDSYVDLAELRGYSLPVTTTGGPNAGPAAGVRNEIQRMSSDSADYHNGGWCNRRPDLFRMLEKGRWGLREEVYNQAKVLLLDDRSVLAAEVTVQRPLAKLDMIVDDVFDNQQIYLMECMAPAPNGQKLVKIGISNDPAKRIAELQTGNPYKIVQRFAVACAQSPAAENKLHAALGAKRMMGEWFTISRNDYGAIGGTIIKHAMDEAVRRRTN